MKGHVGGGSHIVELRFANMTRLPDMSSYAKHICDVQVGSKTGNAGMGNGLLRGQGFEVGCDLNLRV